MQSQVTASRPRRPHARTLNPPAPRRSYARASLATYKLHVLRSTTFPATSKSAQPHGRRLLSRSQHYLEDAKKLLVVGDTRRCIMTCANEVKFWCVVLVALKVRESLVMAWSCVLRSNTDVTLLRVLTSTTVSAYGLKESLLRQACRERDHPLAPFQGRHRRSAHARPCLQLSPSRQGLLQGPVAG